MDETAQNGWYLYVLLCGDGSYYTGITTDVERRLAQHRSGKGARYTAIRLPLRLLGVWSLPDHAAALKAELAFKALPRRRKTKYVASRLPFRDAPYIVMPGL